MLLCDPGVKTVGSFIARVIKDKEGDAVAEFCTKILGEFTATLTDKAVTATKELLEICTVGVLTTTLINSTEGCAVALLLINTVTVPTKTETLTREGVAVAPRLFIAVAVLTTTETLTREGVAVVITAVIAVAVLTNTDTKAVLTVTSELLVINRFGVPLPLMDWL
jgi:hypothetical protein